MFARNENASAVGDRSPLILDQAHRILASPGASLEAFLTALAVAADARSVVLARLGTREILLARAGTPATPPSQPDLSRRLGNGSAAVVTGSDGSSWLVAAAGTPLWPEWALWLRGDTGREWTDAEKAAVALAADATVRFLLRRPEFAAAFRQGRLELAAEVGARVAHDYGNYLTSILGFAELGVHQLDPGEAGYSYLNEVRRSAEAGARFTGRLRQFGRPGRSRGVPTPLQLVFGEEAQRLARETCDAVRLRIDVAPDLPAVGIDLEPLRLLFAQLVDNARDALGGRGTLTVAATTATLTAEDCLALDGSPTPGPCLVVTLTDTGSGLTPEARERVLVEPLFSTKPRHRGLGLGIAAAVARANGAGLRIDPGEAGGTTVRVYLPMAGGLPPEARQRVLVVDKDRMVLRYVALALSGAGYTVGTAGTGPEALEQQRQSPCSLALVDVGLQGMDGVETASRLRRADPRVRLLFTSNQGLPESARKLFGDGAPDLLQKPFPPDRLVQAVRQALSETGDGPRSLSPAGRRPEGDPPW